MKNIVLTFLLLTVLGCTDWGKGKFYKYTIRNESGKTITIKSYLSSFPDVSPFIITINNGDELTKTYQGALPSSDDYDFRYFFGNRKSQRDSLRIIYNNSKIQVFKGRGCSETSTRNPLNLCIYNGTEEIFIFTEEDYQNAENCDDDCN